MATPQSVSDDFKSLTDSQKEEVRSNISGLPPVTPGHGVRMVWMTLLWGLIIISLAGVVAGFVLSNNDKDAAAAWALATAAAGGLVGLLAPSPTSGGGQSLD